MATTDHQRAGNERDPLCPWCRTRHPYGLATAVEDEHGIWYCGRCALPLDRDQECPDPECCGFVMKRPGRLAAGPTSAARRSGPMGRLGSSGYMKVIP